jgi:hypothetical protein
MLFLYPGSILFLLWAYTETESEMTTLLQEFEEWLQQQYWSKDQIDDIPWMEAIKKLEELKKKYKV